MTIGDLLSKVNSGKWINENGSQGIGKIIILADISQLMSRCLRAMSINGYFYSA